MARERLGAEPLEGGSCRFCVWAPRAERVEVVLDDGARVEPLARGDAGYHRGVVDGVGAGDRYRYRLDGRDEFPDPASRFQPEGVHGPSQVVDPAAFRWSDEGWFGLPRRDLVLYELHVGTFSEEGTFAGVAAHLDELVELGVTAIEVMPIAEFPGARNWGYDGAALYAAHGAYGGPDGFRALVDACHAKGLAVVLDVVYNHFGPEGAYAAAYGPYHTDRHRTPWGGAINVDGPGSDEVRRFLRENALMWLTEYHVDGLRLDAVHGIVDTSASPFLAELSEAVDELSETLNRRLHLIAESDLNDPRMVTPREQHGLGMHAQWCDDFHHAVHALVTGERDGYYADFGHLGQLATAYRQGFVYTGQPSRFRGRRHGAPPDGVEPLRFVVYAQNHDQVGNRPRGDRLATLLTFEQQKLVAGLVLLSPFLPLLFQGEEYGEPRPFPYFVSHTDPELAEAVRRGRAEEFAGFFAATETLPDPQAVESFEAARLDRSRCDTPDGRALWTLHRELLRLRRECAPLLGAGRRRTEVVAEPDQRVLRVRRWRGGEEVLCLFQLASDGASIVVDVPAGDWRVVLDSADERFGGPGRARQDVAGEPVIAIKPRSFLVLRNGDS
jgi:maltooligosyltrehalose trehalohydrolase